jgi:LuxR family maltose regulon positive regulatory protein
VVYSDRRRSSSVSRRVSRSSWRHEPPLPLARFRAPGLITEIGTQDLRFGDREALAFVRDGLALDIGTSLVAVLNQRTEGRAAGLQLAGLSLRDTSDVAAFIRLRREDLRTLQSTRTGRLYSRIK